MYYVYGLHLEGDKEIRYVGSTNNPQFRLWRHLNQDKGESRFKKPWIRENYAAVRMKILQTVADDPRGAEGRMIAKLRKEGHRLFNVRRPLSIAPSKQDLVNAPCDVLGVELE